MIIDLETHLSFSGSGVSCKYKHALPPGFILKSKNSKVEEKSEISLEEFLESEVSTIVMNLSPWMLIVFVSVAPQTWSQSYTSYFGNIQRMEEESNGQEGC
jgi:hypothetical protein